jgi:hypothetical protein
MPASPSPRPGRRPDPAPRALWQQRLRRFEQSGLPPASFCAREGVALSSFYAWRRRLTNEPLAKAEGTTHFLLDWLPDRWLLRRGRDSPPGEASAG